MGGESTTPSSDHPSELTVLLATPLEAELAERVGTQTPGATVLFEPELLPEPRYPSDHAGDVDFVRTPGDQDRFESLLGRAEVLLGVPGETPQSLRETVQRGPRLHWIQGTSAGFGEQIREAELAQKDLERILFTSSVGVHASQLAEWAMLGLLYFTKGVPRLLDDARSRRWPHYPVAELAGKRLLIVGLGHIGKEVAHLARGLGMHVTGVRRHPDATDLAHLDAIGTIEDLGELLSGTDAVVLALPGSPQTDGLLDAALFQQVRTGAILVNVGRGTTVDEPALIEALRSGRLIGAALDVVSTEPLPPESPLWSLDNVLLSPHTAALSRSENELVVQLFIDNLHRYAGGRPLRNLVDLQAFY